MDKLNKLEQYCNEQNIPCTRDALTAELSTFRIGGPVDLLLQPGSQEQIAEIRRMAHKHSIPLLVLGRGSNVLFADEGYRGVILQLGASYAQMQMTDEETIACDSGASLMQLCLFACENGLAGLEFAYGIPGSVGGAIYMNAGAYGGETKDVLEQAGHIEPDGSAGVLRGEALQLSYRHSAYSDTQRIITSGLFRLRRDDPDAIRARMDDYMSRRRTKQPLEYPSAGSTFKRPQGAYASALIDECGLKGRTVGGAMVSEKHAGFVVNTGGATCADVLGLIEAVRHEVQQKTGFLLECEVKVIG